MRYLLTNLLMRLAKWVHGGHCDDYDWHYGEHPSSRDHMWVREQQYAPDTGEPTKITARTCRICAKRQEFKLARFNWQYSRNGKGELESCAWCGSSDDLIGVWDGGARHDPMCAKCFTARRGRPPNDTDRAYKIGWWGRVVDVQTGEVVSE